MQKFSLYKELKVGSLNFELNFVGQTNHLHRLAYGNHKKKIELYRKHLEGCRRRKLAKGWAWGVLGHFGRFLG